MTNYLWTLVIHNVILAVTAFLLGVWVCVGGIRVNYTRKLNHFAVFFTPFLLMPLLPYQPNAWTLTTSAVVFLLVNLFFLRAVRERVAAADTAFASVDRPEDRPHTLLWLYTQYLLAYAAMVGILYWHAAYDRVELVAMTVLVTALGDGLAEPVGVRFGRHTYRVRALFTDRSFHRTLEGSACVFLMTLLVVVGNAWQLSAAELTWLLALMPIVMTLTEAFSPHTCDAPFLYLMGGTTTIAVVHWTAPV